MLRTRPEATVDTIAIPALPGWIVAAPAETLGEVAFRSGAALAHLHLVAGQAAVPQALWRARLALAAAEVCAGLAGRKEGAAALRDAVHLTKPGDHAGPAGAIFGQWSRVVARPISVVHLGKAIAGVAAERIAVYLDAVGSPVERAAGVLEAVLTDAPRAKTAALILGDAVLAKALGRNHMLPLLSLALKARDLRMRGDDLQLTCHRAVVVGVRQAIPLAATLVRSAARLRGVVPSLRAKGATRAIELFLSQDALAPGALTGIMSDRAARRLCDRLVDLGVLRELTGRATFRVYGL